MMNYSEPIVANDIHKDRLVTAFFTSNSKFNDDLARMACQKHSIEGYTRQISFESDRQQYAHLLRVKDLVEELEKPLSRIEHVLDPASNALLRQQNQVVLDWISKIPFQKHLRVIEDKALPGTGEWLFSDISFSDWQNSSRSQIFWLHGSSGSGKSTLTSLLLRSLIGTHKQQQTPYPIYFFCARNSAEPERANPEKILQSMLRQASDLPGGPPLHGRLKERFEDRRIAGDISSREATELIIDTIENRPLSYIVIDALDECDRRTRDTLTDSLKQILLSSKSLVKILVTSRDSHQDIVWSMKGFPAICIDASQNQTDVERYVRYSVRNAIERKKLLPTENVTEDLQRRIEDSLRKSAKGMFRWVELQIKFLCSLRKRSILLQRLERLPPELEQIYADLYEYNMKELGEEQAEIVRKILSWLLIAQRPLNTSEICELVCAPEEPDMSVNTVLDMCFDLVRLDHAQDQFRFSHLSVREFLEKRPSEFEKPRLHYMATLISLSLVTRHVNKLAKSYAGCYWPLHAEETARSGGGSMLEHPLRTFFRSIDFVRWNEELRRALSDPLFWDSQEHSIRLSQTAVPGGSTVFIEACFGLQIHLRDVLEQPFDIGQENLHGQDALYLASEYGHLQNVQLLLHKSSSCNVGKALGVASMKGHVNIVELLLATFSNADAQVFQAIALASGRGHADVIKVLLKKLKSPDTLTGVDPLCVASGNGHADVVKLLLANSDVVKIKADHDHPALPAASENGHSEIVKLLLDNGADINAPSPWIGNALYAATYRGHKSTVKLLLERGADVNALGCSALEAASRGGHMELIQLLLREYGVDVNMQGGFHGSALKAAAFEGRTDVVKLLLEEGASINAEKSGNGGALEVACSGGYIDIVMLLLEHGADIEMSGEKYSKALYAASLAGRLEVVELLLSRGTDINAHGGQYGSALQAATAQGHADVLKLLLEKGAEVNAQGGAYGSALVIACHTGLQDIVMLLLDKGAGVNEISVGTAPGTQYYSALQAAYFRGRTELVKSLLDRGADADTAQLVTPWRSCSESEELPPKIWTRPNTPETRALAFASSKFKTDVLQVMISRNVAFKAGMSDRPGAN
nr:ankyrin-3 [Quercus suber]